jgi:hypothetical protein
MSVVVSLPQALADEAHSGRDKSSGWKWRVIYLADGTVSDHHT